MSLVAHAINHAREVRFRLRNPPNAVPDYGIDLKRKPKLKLVLVGSVPLVPVMPLGIGQPIPDYQLSYGKEPMHIPQRLLPLTIGDIQRAVCSKFDIAMIDLVAHRRTAVVIKPRHIAIWLCRTMTPFPLTKIGKQFGDRDHTTILHSFRKIESDRKFDAALEVTLFDLRADLGGQRS